MGLFSFLKRSSSQQNTSTGPYTDEGINNIYSLLFCDNIELFKSLAQTAEYPFNIIFAAHATVEELTKIAEDTSVESRVRVLAYNKLLSVGYKPAPKQLLAVIVEVGLEDGLDVLACFKDGRARYINQSGALIIWETADDRSTELSNTLFLRAHEIVNRLGGPWAEPRRPYPKKGTMRISFLASDGLYFGEGPIDMMFNDAMAGPAIATATEFMTYLIEKSKG